MSDTKIPPPKQRPRDGGERPTVRLLLPRFQNISRDVDKLTWLEYPVAGELERKLKRAMEGTCDRIRLKGMEFRITYSVDLDHGEDTIYCFLMNQAEADPNIIDKLMDKGWEIHSSETGNYNAISTTKLGWKIIWGKLIDLMDDRGLARLMRTIFGTKLRIEDFGAEIIYGDKLAQLNKLIKQQRDLDRQARRAKREKK